MIKTIKTSVLTTAAALLPFTAVLSSTSATAQPDASAPEAQQQTICRYDPESGFDNVLGMRTYITLTEAEGNTTVTLERFPSFVFNPENVAQRADVSDTRSLTLYNLPIGAARQLMIDQPFYYAHLLETDVDDIGEGFAAIDQTLGCGQVAAEPEATESETDPGAEPGIESETTEPEATEPETTETEPETTEPTPEEPEPTAADLPNGNYRFVSADFETQVVTDEELAEAEGNIFLFRKFGDRVTGVISAIGSESEGFCVTGSVEGDTVSGSISGACRNQPVEICR